MDRRQFLLNGAATSLGARGRPVAGRPPSPAIFNDADDVDLLAEVLNRA